MKQIELNLQKRLLIVEPSENEEIVHLVTNSYAIKYDGKELYTHLDNKNDLKLICKGSELTEEILKKFVESKRISSSEGEIFPDYKNKGWLYGKPDRIKSFISAIEANGYYWGENPIKHPDNIVIQPASLNWWHEQEESFLEAESKTFNPEKTLIFEILL